MNLSKIEKIIVVILVMGGIIAAGIFFFIKPANDNINKAKSNLESLEKEKATIEEELAQESVIDEEIKTKKESVAELEGEFYPDLTTYEAVEIILAHLKEANLVTYGVEANPLTTQDLELEFYQAEPVIYDLKTYAETARGTDENALLEGQFRDDNKVYTITANSVTDIAITNEDGETVEIAKYTETMQKAYKEALCKTAALQETRETVGVTAVSFDVTGRYEDYLKFLDYLYGLDRATYMQNVSIPMTYEPEKEEAETIEGVAEAEEDGINVVLACENDTEVTVPMEILFFSVEQMEELETIDAAGTEIVVNQ